MDHDHLLELKATLEGHQERVWNVAWNPTGTQLASCSADKSISFLLGVDHVRVTRECSFHDQNSGVSFDIITIDYAPLTVKLQIRIWGLEGEKWVCKVILSDGHQRTIRSVNWSPCGNFVASASFDGTTCIWDKRSGEFQCTSTLEGHENEVKCAAWSSCGNYLATCSRDKSVWVWDILEDGEEYECASVILHHTQDVKYVRWHPIEQLLISSSYDNTIKVYREDDDDWTCVSSLEGHDSTVWSVSFDPSGNRLASCSADKSVKVWQRYKVEGEEAMWKCVCSLQGYHQRDVYDIDWSLSDYIATAGGDDTLRIFREASSVAGSETNFDLVWKEPKAHDGDVNCVKWNPKDSTFLATCSDDNTIKIWKFS